MISCINFWYRSLLLFHFTSAINICIWSVWVFTMAHLQLTIVNARADLPLICYQLLHRLITASKQTRTNLIKFSKVPSHNLGNDMKHVTHEIWNYTSSFPTVTIGKKKASVQMTLLSRRPNSTTLAKYWYNLTIHIQ